MRASQFGDFSLGSKNSEEDRGRNRSRVYRITYHTVLVLSFLGTLKAGGPMDP